MKLLNQMHRSGHTLDLFFSDQDDTSIKLVTKGYMLSDHTFIDSTIEVQHNKPTTRLIKYRKFKDINKDLFLDDVLENLSPLLVSSEQTMLSDMVDTYNNGIQAAINKHYLLMLLILFDFMKNQRFSHKQNKWSKVV